MVHRSLRESSRGLTTSAAHDQIRLRPENVPEHCPPLTIDVFDSVFVMDRPDPLVRLFRESRHDLTRPRITEVNPATDGTPSPSGAEPAVLPGATSPLEGGCDILGGDPSPFAFADGHATSDFEPTGIEPMSVRLESAAAPTGETNGPDVPDRLRDLQLNRLDRHGNFRAISRLEP